MAKNPIRRSQLISPFGVGAMFVSQGGIGLLTAGLDHWYKREGDGSLTSDVGEYCIEEWRLQRLLHVKEFRLPPDYRELWRFDGTTPNMQLTIPFLRFPTWHFCPRCDLLDKRPLTEQSRPDCSECKKKHGWEIKMFQVPFVTMCEAGHLQEFPWKEWVHRQQAVDCEGLLRWKTTGSASLSGQKVICDKCQMERTLANITTAYGNGATVLSTQLTEDDQDYLCPGRSTWLSDDVVEQCTAHMRGTLRNASNVYYANVHSAIYLPRGTSTAPGKLIEVLSNRPFNEILQNTYDLVKDIDRVANHIYDRYSKGHDYSLILDGYSKEQICEATQIVLKSNETAPTSEEQIMLEEIDLLREEFAVLQQPINDEKLQIRATNIDEYESEITQYFSRIMLIDKLRETRAFAGFSRIFATNTQDLSHRKRMLRRPDTRPANWLPAYVVFGEGLFFMFDEVRLSEWEQNPIVQERIKRLENRFLQVQRKNRWVEQPITPRFVLLHTFSHLLMNRLIFECGYSSAALKERLYVSNHPDEPMAGVLIYTAAGDAEGTMGGLVRMGNRGNIEPVIRRALQEATWCSVDPVCSEVGSQGPDSCNLAACHNCALVPETACNHFNRFLDRVTVVGAMNNPQLGYFDVG